MNIYDSRPTDEALRARCRRERIDPSTLVEVVAKRGHYAIRCYGRPVTMTEWASVDGAVKQVEVPGFILYSMRGDGRICNGWGLPRKASEMLSIGAAQ